MRALLLLFASSAAFVIITTGSNARAQEPAPATPPAVSAAPPIEHPSAPSIPSTTPAYPFMGGHLGVALPIIKFSTKTTKIGSDFTAVGLTPGMTVHLDAEWAIDFEFIALNEFKNTPAGTSLVVDPGILHKWPGFVAGLRVATKVGALTNVGLVPIFVLPIKLNERASWFIEADVPLFFNDNGTKALFSVTGQVQSGVAF